MGIKNLFKVISENAPNSIIEKSLKELKGKVVVLDASMIIYQFVIAIRNTGTDLENTEGIMTTHILGVININSSTCSALSLEELNSLPSKGISPRIGTRLSDVIIVSLNTPPRTRV